MLSGAGYRKPSGLFVHGHVTVDGQKISKRRGNFITAADFAKKIDPDYLRYYYAAKLGSTTDDLDLNLADFVAKVNSDLVGKLVNIASRCAGFVHKLGGGRLAEPLPEPDALRRVRGRGRRLGRGLRAARVLARRAQDHGARRSRQSVHRRAASPGSWPRTPGAAAEVVAVCTLGLNLFRALIVYLKPIVPALAARAEALLAAGELRWSDAAAPLLGTRIAKFEALLTRVEMATVESLTKPAASEAHAVTTVTTRTAAASNGEIDLAEFQKTELRVARVIEASYVDGADKLLKLKLDVGDEERTVFSGIRSSYEPAALTNRLVDPRRELGAAQNALRRLARHGPRRERRRARHLPALPRFGRQARHEGELAMSELLLIALGAALVNNFVLVQLLGVCPFIGGSQRVEGAIGMSLAMALVLDARGRRDAARRPLPAAAVRARVSAPVRAAARHRRRRGRHGARDPPLLAACCNACSASTFRSSRRTAPCSASRSSTRRRAAASSRRCSTAPARRSASGSR